MKRLLSLDVFRGMTIASMILVNTIIVTPFPTLEHAKWNGVHFADLIFPFFLVVVGISLVLSLSKQMKRGDSHTDIIIKIVQRTFIILLLGYLLNLFPNHLTLETIATVRVYGVLQRIALCYFFAALCYLYLSRTEQLALIFILLIGYWLLMMYVPVPHYGAGNLTTYGNLGGYIDRLLFPAANLYGKTYDPEGLLGTVPALASTLLGSMAGIFLLSSKTKQQKCIGMLLAGIAGMALGWIWSQWFPFNKPLWTSSFVLWTTGMALCIYAICYALIEIKGIVFWSKPFEIFGLNAIAVYFLHVIFFKVQILIHLYCNQAKLCNLRQVILQDIFGWASLPYASFYYAITTVLFWLFILTILYKRKIFIKV